MFFFAIFVNLGVNFDVILGSGGSLEHPKSPKSTQEASRRPKRGMSEIHPYLLGVIYRGSSRDFFFWPFLAVYIEGIFDIFLTILGSIFAYFHDFWQFGVHFGVILGSGAASSTQRAPKSAQEASRRRKSELAQLYSYRFGVFSGSFLGSFWRLWGYLLRAFFETWFVYALWLDFEAQRLQKGGFFTWPTCCSYG